jgi:hypothetical protein
MRFISFNILNLENEKKYNPKSLILKKYGSCDEKRIEFILNAVKEKIYLHTFIGLQEFPIIYLPIFEKEFSNKYDIFINNKTDTECQLLLSPKEFDMVQEEIKDETAYGYVYISNGHMRVVNCHLRPEFVAKKDIWSVIRGFRNDKITFVLGDFNTERNLMLRRIGKKYFIPVNGKTYKNKCIDNIIMNYYPTLYRVCIDTSVTKNLLSDHNLIFVDVL